MESEDVLGGMLGQLLAVVSGGESRAKGSAHAVGTAVAYRCHLGSGQCRFSIEELRSVTGLCAHSVIDALRTLEASGLIKREPQNRGPARIEWLTSSAG